MTMVPTPPAPATAALLPRAISMVRSANAAVRPMMKMAVVVESRRVALV
jgi:hypothetical protein